MRHLHLRRMAPLVVVCFTFFTGTSFALRCEVVSAPGFEICQNDCNRDGVVTVEELLLGVRVRNGSAPLSACPETDGDHDDAVTTPEIDAAVGVALRGCPAKPPAHAKLTCPPGETMCNVAASAGIADRAYGKGAAIVDVDGDGWDDIWASDSDSRTTDAYGTSTLYHNNGDGTFTKRDLGLDDSDVFLNWTGSFADYDNDGDADLLLTNGGYGGSSSLVLYRNDLKESDRFVNVSATAGINSGSTAWWGASWADFDGDGWLDFAVTPLSGRVSLYHNLGNGTFEELPVTPDADMHPPRDDLKDPVWLDYDLDGDQDLYVAGVFPTLYRNDGGGLFTDVGDIVLEDGTEYYKIHFVFAAASEDFNQDGLPDLFLGRFMMQDLLLLNRGDGTFALHGPDVGIVTLTESGDSPLGFDDPKWAENTMGLGVGDLDEDGLPDVFIGTGNPKRKFPDILFCNVGTPPNVAFTRCSDAIVRGHGATQTHGIALGDLDADGDMDVFYNIGGMTAFDGTVYPDSRDPHAFYVTEPAVKPNTAMVRLEGRRSNRDALGARLRVEGSSTRYYTVHSTQGFQSQNSHWQVLTFGENHDGTVRITWPLGGECEVHLETGDRVVVREPQDAPAPATTVALARPLKRRRPSGGKAYSGPSLTAPFPRCGMEGHATSTTAQPK